MPDDTATTLSEILRCKPWEVVDRVTAVMNRTGVHEALGESARLTRRVVELEGLVAALQADIAADAETVAKAESLIEHVRHLEERLAAALDEVDALGDYDEILRRAKVARIEQARRIAPQAGRFRTSVLAALRRGKTWTICEEDYDALVARPCSYCGGPLGNGIGLDRLDVRVGYEMGNVVSSCGPCNVERHRRGDQRAA